MFTSGLRVLQIPVFFPHHLLTLTFHMAAACTLSGFYSHIQLELMAGMPAPSYREPDLRYF